MKSQELLTEWVARKHAGQLIRKTSEPYLNHLLFVAEASREATDFGYEIGLCHDLFEDTSATAEELTDALIGFGYSQLAVKHITTCVVELTDVFTKSAYPEMKKGLRKKRETARLHTISPAAQTVKYGDLIDNVGWVLKHKRNHADKYLLKKMCLLNSMNHGDHLLHKKALHAILKGLRILPC